MRALLLASLLLASLLAAPAAAQTTRIGAAGAVSGRVTAAAPGASERGLSSGGDVFFKDAVQTDARGRLQVMLLDETVFTVGPDSRIALDEFVYNPYTDAGKVTAQVTKGVFRFVTGKVARKKPEGMKVKLPVGTIGIRGTIAGGRVEPDGSALVALLGPGAGNNADERPGGMTVANAGGSVNIDEPGYATRISGPDSPPSPPFPLTPELLASLNAAPEPSGSDSGSDGGSGSAAEESGQDTAVGGESAAVEAGAAKDKAGLAETSNLAAQSLALGGAFGWEDLRNSLTSGSAFYSGQGGYSCTGGPCSTSSSGQFSFHFNIDWGARTLGGGGSQSHIAFTESGSSGALNQTPGAAPGLIEATIPVINFGALSGAAKLIFGTDFIPANSNDAFNGSSFAFKDAKTVDVSMTYNGNLQNGGLAAYASGASASGTTTTTCSSGSCPP